MGKQELLRGQAEAIQLVSFALQRINADINNGGRITNYLIGNQKTDNSKIPLQNLRTGNIYTINFILPLALELALKALIIQSNKSPKFIHNLLTLFNLLPKDIQTKLNEEYITQKKNGGITDSKSFEQLLQLHNNDFVEWRYLDKPENLKIEDKEIQIAISSILEVYEKYI